MWQLTFTSGFWSVSISIVVQIHDASKLLGTIVVEGSAENTFTHVVHGSMSKCCALDGALLECVSLRAFVSNFSAVTIIA